jgi:copper chaperone CopZ
MKLTTTMTSKPMLYLGIGLALLSSDLCLLLLILNSLSWLNLLHMDLTFIEQAAETISTKHWQVYFQTGTIAWLVLVLISSLQKQQQAEQVGGPTDDKVTKTKSISSKGALVKSISIVVLTLLTPHMLKSHRDRHPILRRSLISHQPASVTSGADSSVNKNEQANSVTRQELAFSVDNMTCGGCGSHVRNLVEANLNKQQQSSSSSMTIDKVTVDWRSGVISIYGYGDNLSKLVDQSVIIDMLEEEGYPTSFLYVN